MAMGSIQSFCVLGEAAIKLFVIRVILIGNKEFGDLITILVTAKRLAACVID
jgi:hypothetical protein